MLVGIPPGERVALPDITYALIDSAGALSMGSAPGDAVAVGDDLLDQPGLREHLSWVVGGELDVYAHAPGLVAVCCARPLQGVNPLGRRVLEGLEAHLAGAALLRVLHGPLALLAVEEGEEVTSSLDEGHRGADQAHMGAGGGGSDLDAGSTMITPPPAGSTPGNVRNPPAVLRRRVALEWRVRPAASCGLTRPGRACARTLRSPCGRSRRSSRTPQPPVAVTCRCCKTRSSSVRVPCPACGFSQSLPFSSNDAKRSSETFCNRLRLPRPALSLARRDRRISPLRRE